jgi:hypothetical protein
MKPITKVLVALEVFLAVGGLYGGFSLLNDPTGSALGMPLTALGGSLFDSYLVPGIVLFAVNGILPLVAVASEFAEMPWAKYGHVLVGMLLTGWMGVQVWVVGLTAFIQVVYLLLGIVILALAAFAIPELKARRWIHI